MGKCLGNRGPAPQVGTLASPVLPVRARFTDGRVGGDGTGYSKPRNGEVTPESGRRGVTGPDPFLHRTDTPHKQDGVPT